MQTIVNVMVDKQLYKYVGHIQEIAYIFIKVINYIVLQSTMNDLNFFGLKKSLLSYIEDLENSHRGKMFF